MLRIAPPNSIQMGKTRKMFIYFELIDILKTNEIKCVKKSLNKKVGTCPQF